MAASVQDEQRLALFIDFENIAIGVRDAHYRKFDIDLVLERLLDKGKLLSKKAYADWSRYSDYKRAFHEAAIELIEVPQKSVGGKNSADIRLVVDAMDMSFQKEHINCFVVCSGDSDFSPLVSKLKENNKYVIGLGVKNSTSDLLIENCDEFIFYEDLVRVQQRPMPGIAGSLPEKLQDCFNLLVDAIVALQRENKEVLWGSMVKETMKRKRPSFNEGYYGFRTFSHLLEDAQRRGILTLRRDQRSGSYIVEDLGPAAARQEAGAAAESTERKEPAAAPSEDSGERRSFRPASSWAWRTAFAPGRRGFRRRGRGRTLVGRRRRRGGRGRRRGRLDRRQRVDGGRARAATGLRDRAAGLLALLVAAPGSHDGRKEGIVARGSYGHPYDPPHRRRPTPPAGPARSGPWTVALGPRSFRRAARRCAAPGPGRARR